MLCLRCACIAPKLLRHTAPPRLPCSASKAALILMCAIASLDFGCKSDPGNQIGVANLGDSGLRLKITKDGTLPSQDIPSRAGR